MDQVGHQWPSTQKSNAHTVTASVTGKSVHFSGVSNPQVVYVDVRNQNISIEPSPLFIYLFYVFTLNFVY